MGRTAIIAMGKISSSFVLHQCKTFPFVSVIFWKKRRIIKKFDPERVILPIKYMSPGCTIVSLRSEALMNTSCLRERSMAWSGQNHHWTSRTEFGQQMRSLANCLRTCLWIVFYMAFFLVPDAILIDFGPFLRNSTRVWPTDRPTDRPTDGQTLL